MELDFRSTSSRSLSLLLQQDIIRVHPVQKYTRTILHYCRYVRVWLVCYRPPLRMRMCSEVPFWKGQANMYPKFQKAV